jgi:hypothetical protein
MMIAITAETEAKLRQKAEEEGRDVDTVADSLLSRVLDEEAADVIRHDTGVIDREARPFLQDPRLVGVRFHEDPTAAIDPQDWPEAFE